MNGEHVNDGNKWWIYVPEQFLTLSNQFFCFVKGPDSSQANELRLVLLSWHIGMQAKQKDVVCQWNTVFGTNGRYN